MEATCELASDGEADILKRVDSTLDSTRPGGSRPSNAMEEQCADTEDSTADIFML